MVAERRDIYVGYGNLGWGRAGKKGTISMLLLSAALMVLLGLKQKRRGKKFGGQSLVLQI
jgi:hypothetical protein